MKIKFFKILALSSIGLIACSNTGQKTTTPTDKQEINQEIKKENKMKIEIWSDVMCPFCYIGKRNYEQALAKFKDAQHVELVWKSYQLDPNVSTEKITESSYEYIAKRRGWSIEQTMEIHQGVVKSAKDAGLTFNFDKSKVANSFNAHRIIQFAKLKGWGDKAEEQFFKAHFTDGKDMNSKEDLMAIGKNIGLTEAEVTSALTEEKYAELVRADIQEAAQLQIQGVPFFVFNRKYAISGAQPADVFLQTLEKAFAEWRKDNPESPFEVINGQVCTPEGECK